MASRKAAFVMAPNRKCSTLQYSGVLFIYVKQLDAAETFYYGLFNESISCAGYSVGR